MKILGIGEVMIDRVMIIPEYIREDSKSCVEKSTCSIGGTVPSALALLKRLGGTCTLVASVGADSNGEYIRNTLEAEGIELVAKTQEKTREHFIFVNKTNGSRTIVKGDTKYKRIKTVPKKLLDDADMIIMDRHEEGAIEYVMQNKKKHTKVLIDPSTEVSIRTLRMCEYSDYPILPVESLVQIKKYEHWRQSLRYLYKRVCRPIIVTSGSLGAFIYDGGDIDFVPATDITCIDANGAGDVFRGAFCYGMYKGWDLRKSVEYGNIVAGLQCQNFGNLNAVPKKSDINKTLKNIKFKEFIETHVDQMLM